VLIPAGGTLVIGGLIEDTATNSEQRVPWLSRIPLIGELFKVRDTSKGKTNLMVFMQPHILHDDREAALETDSKYEYVRDQQRKVGHDSAVLPLTLPNSIPPAQPPDLNKPTRRPTAPQGIAPPRCLGICADLAPARRARPPPARQRPATSPTGGAGTTRTAPDSTSSGSPPWTMPALRRRREVRCPLRLRAGTAAGARAADGSTECPYRSPAVPSALAEVRRLLQCR
jgi:hypothetical protein